MSHTNTAQPQSSIQNPQLSDVTLRTSDYLIRVCKGQLTALLECIKYK